MGGGEICCGADEMINNRLIASATDLCLLVPMIVEKRGVSKLSDYTVTPDPFSVCSHRADLFVLSGYEWISLVRVSRRRPSCSQIVVSVVF